MKMLTSFLFLTFASASLAQSFNAYFTNSKDLIKTAEKAVIEYYAQEGITVEASQLRTEDPDLSVLPESEKTVRAEVDFWTSVIRDEEEGIPDFCSASFSVSAMHAKLLEVNCSKID